MDFLPALGVYVILMIAAGIYGARKGTGISHYFVANRDLGLLPTASTITATTVGGSATITSVIMIYTYGLTGVIGIQYFPTHGDPGAVDTGPGEKRGSQSSR